MTKQKLFLKGTIIISLLVLVSLLGSYFHKKQDDIGFYLNDNKTDTISIDDSVIFHKAVCNNDTTVSWDDNAKGLLFSNLKQKTRCNLYFVKSTYEFDYTGGEQIFTAPVSGTYKLETWGAQGGTYEKVVGGYGGYSSGNISLNKGETLYINAGGTTLDYNGGYNGGGNGSNSISSSDLEMINKYLGGGGATHIALKSGLLNSLENFKDLILIVAGGGGGIYNYSYQKDLYVDGGSAGGYVGNDGKTYINEEKNPVDDIPTTGGNQTTGGLGNNSSSSYAGAFGQGGNGNNRLGTGGGGGFYGGGGSYNVGFSAESGAGGSGYIGNSLLNGKNMYCYNCQESDEESTKTISTTCNEETPTENCAKKGNGYARITLISIDE